MTLRNDEDLTTVARYLIANPVRAGLVDRAGMYPFWDAVWVGEDSGRAQVRSYNSAHL